MIPAYFVPVFAVGAIGAVARYLVDAYVATRFPSTLPWGTFAVNLSGSLLLGFFTGMVAFDGEPTAIKVILGTGFCGAYTTFSTFSFETIRLVEEGSLREAAANVLGSFFFGLLAAGAGLALGAWI